MRNEAQIKCVRDESAVDIVRLLKACTTRKDLWKGSKLHAYIREKGFLEKNSYVTTCLVAMYAECGALSKAEQVLSELPVQNVVTWNALITGYGKHGQAEEALKCYDSMQLQGNCSDAITFTCALKACGSIRAFAKGRKIHDKIVTLCMLEKDVLLGSTLVDMYVKCGALIMAQQVLDGLPLRDVVTWNALIAGYAQQGHGQEALTCYLSMQCDGLCPDAVTLTCALKACGAIKATTHGEQIHERIDSLGLLGKNFVLQSALVDMYAKCGALAKAKQVLKKLPIRDIVSWSALIAGYAHHRQGEKALECYDCMLIEGHFPNAAVFACALKACGSIRSAAKGKQIHNKIISLGMLEKHIVLGSTLVHMYSECGELGKAQQVLEELPVRDVVTWGALIAGHIQHGQGEEALKCYDSMQCEGHTPNTIIFTCALKACGTIGAAAKGEQIHDNIVNLGLLDKDIVLGSALVDMYVKFGALTKAHQVLKKLPVRDVVVWNALIAGYAQQGQGQEALKCFDGMQQEGHTADAVAFTCALKACGSIGAAAKGEQIHDQIANLAMLEKNIVLGTALVDLYCKCGALAKAQQLLEELPVRDVVMWNALIAGYAQQGQGEEALKCYDSMQQEGCSPNMVTFISALKACGSIGAAAKGEQIHDNIASLGMLEKDIVLGSTLVNMYVKCASFEKAQEVIEELPLQNVVTWNALIGGYAHQGWSYEALNYFEKMQCKGVEPDSTTLICAFNACSHSGLLYQAEMAFSRSGTQYCITPDVEHYCCMVDLLGRVGKLNKALRMIEMMPSAEDFPVWVALLAACRQWGEVRIGKLAFDHVLKLDKSNASVYISMANIYRAFHI